MTPQEFRRFGHELVDLIADYRSNISDRPVMAQAAPGEIMKLLPPVHLRSRSRFPQFSPTSSTSFTAVYLIGSIHASLDIFPPMPF